jgi:hypothetical protein
MEDDFCRFRVTLFHSAMDRGDGRLYWLPHFHGVLRDGRDRWCFLYWFALGLHVEWTVGSAVQAFRERIDRENRENLATRH